MSARGSPPDLRKMPFAIKLPVAPQNVSNFIKAFKSPQMLPLQQHTTLGFAPISRAHFYATVFFTFIISVTACFHISVFSFHSFEYQLLPGHTLYSCALCDLGRPLDQDKSNHFVRKGLGLFIVNFHSRSLIISQRTWP